MHRRKSTSGPEERALGDVRVRDRMSIGLEKDRMRAKQVRRLVVLDQKGQPTGPISVDDAADLEAPESAVAAVLAKSTVR